MKAKFVSVCCIVIFLSFQSWAQECLVKELTQESFNENGESKERLQYSFSYTPNRELKEITIKDNSTTDGSTNHTLKFEQVALGRKITWFWDGEYDSHYILSKEGLLEFASDDENDVNPENADKYPLVFENNQLTFDEDSNTTYSWKDSLVTTSIRQGRKFKNTTVFGYADVPNPFYGLFELGAISISVDNFIPVLYTMPTKLFASEEVTQEKEGVKQDYDKTDKFSHTINQNQCVEQFTVDKGRRGKLVFTFTY